MEESGKKAPSLGLITTPASYYSTPKARYLGERYKENLDRIVEGIVRNPKTANLQFANNIAAVGGIGFFTHSVAKSPDERYLEVILSVPETFEKSGEFNSKVYRLFTLYGTDLLAVLSSDSAIYNEKEVSGYGLNLSWRKIAADPRGPRVALERAIVYFPKQKVRAFLTREVSQNDLLSEAVIFAAEEQGPTNLVSYRPSEPSPDFRPPIREENIATAKVQVEAQSELPSEATVSKPAPSATLPSKVEKKIETPESRQPPANEAKLEAAAETTKPTVSGSSQPAAAPAPSKPRETATQTIVAAPREKRSVEAVPAPSEVAREKVEPTAPKQSVKERKPESASISPMEGGHSDRPPSSARPIQKPEPEKSAENKSKSQRLLETTGPQRPVEQGPAEEKKVSPPVVSPKEPATLVNPSPAAIAPTKQQKAGEPKDREVATPVPPSKTPAQIRAGNETKPQLLPKDEVGGAAKAKSPAALPAETNERKAIESKNQAGAKAPPPVIDEDKSESAAVVAKLENRAAAGSEPAPKAKQEIPGEAANRSASVPTKVEKPAEVQPVVQKKAEPPPAVASKEIKPPAVSQAAPTPVFPVKQEKASEPKAPEAAAPPEPIKPATPNRSVERKPEPVPVTPKEAPLAVDAKAAGVLAEEEKSSQKSANEQIALLRTKPSETVAAKKPLVRPAPKALEGYVIQVAFSERAKARNWAEAMEHRGYAVSVTETGGAGSVRVRIGNFAAADDAERQLRNFRQEGLAAIVINLPQAFRPGAAVPAERGRELE